MICDSTPLICLSRINKLDLLKKLFCEVIISEEVRGEVVIANKTGCELIKEGIEAGWIRILKVKKMLNFGFGRGENAAISLAKELKDKLVIDDAKAVKVACILGIDVLRTTSVITKSIGKKILTLKEGLEAINELIETGYYISPKIYIKLVDGLK